MKRYSVLYFDRLAHLMYQSGLNGYDCRDIGLSVSHTFGVSPEIITPSVSEV